jgi:rhodanese-related sulfurtransferase
MATHLRRAAMEMALIVFVASVSGLIFNMFSANGISLLYSRPHINDQDNISVWQAYELYVAGRTLFVDARTPQEFDFIRIENSLNIPAAFTMDQIADRIAGYEKNRMMVVYCTSFNCTYSVKIAKMLRLLKYTNVFIFRGGIEEWDNMGYPLEKPK